MQTSRIRSNLGSGTTKQDVYNAVYNAMPSKYIIADSEAVIKSFGIQYSKELKEVHKLAGFTVNIYRCKCALGVIYIIEVV